MNPVRANPTAALIVDYDPVPTYDRIQRFRRLFRGRLIGFGIALAILTGLTIWQYDRVPLRYLIVGNAVVVGLWLVMIGVTWWLAHRAKGAVSTLGEGTALVLDRGGVQLVGRAVAWEEVVALDTAKGPLLLGPRFRVRDRSGGALTVPWDQLATKPATLDSAARAYSGGRFGVDLSAFDA